MVSTRSRRGTFQPVLPWSTRWPRGPEITLISPGEAETKLAQRNRRKKTVAATAMATMLRKGMIVAFVRGVRSLCPWSRVTRQDSSV